jgi:hypothetical protein
VINNNVKTAWIFTAGYSVSNIKKAQLIPAPMMLTIFPFTRSYLSIIYFFTIPIRR